MNHEPVTKAPVTKAPVTKSSGRPGFLVLLPAILFGILAMTALVQLLSGRDITAVPSALIGKPVPLAQLGTLAGYAAYNPELPGQGENKPSIVNVWASWCAPCRQEHPLLLELTKDERFVLIGINYKDKPENAAGFLSELGNPFDRIGTDINGRTAIDWGVYGVPETFIVGRNGLIHYKHVGPLTEGDMTGAFGKALETALEGTLQP